MSRLPSAFQLARDHANAGRLDQGIALLLRHLRQAPSDIPATLLMAELHVRMSRFDRAEFYYSKAVTLLPTDPQLRSDHGHTLLALGRHDQAISRFQEALSADPTLWMAYSGMAQAYTNKHEFREAIRYAEEGIRHNPGIPELYDHLARALMLGGCLEESIEAARRGISIAPGFQRLRATLAVSLTYSDKASPDDVVDAYRANGAAIAASRSIPPVTWPNSKDPDRPLRIGYLSPDFRLHSIAYFMEPIFTHSDPASVIVHAYSLSTYVDAVTDRLKSLVTARGGRWISTVGLSLDDMVKRMRSDKLDLLVELAGHSHGGLLAMMLLRPAPVQVSYLGWASTTGVPSIDWRLVDSHTDPPGYESHSTERLARMPGCFVCYGGERHAPAPALPAPPGPITFASFNAVYKITPACVRAWSAALKSTPGSRMLIKAAQLEHEDLRRSITAMFESCSIEASRLDLRPRTPELVDHFNAYGEAHIALDTFPYNGTTTTCEALWQGVPVVTLEGAMHAGRVGMSLLSALGIPEWVARDEAGFARIASELAADRASLAQLRTTLRDRMKASLLCDGATFTRSLESAYRTMWRDWCARGAP